MFEDQVKQLRQFNKLVHSSTHADNKLATGQLRVGIDLGTATIVFAVINEQGDPVYGESVPDQAIRDGVIVNYLDAVRIVQGIRERAEAALGTQLTTAAGAIPPGVGTGNSKAVANVIEDAGLHCSNIVDEPTAAATFLKVKTGTIVDVGGGTTGISVFENNKLIHVGDEATGGYHMTLVLAGSEHISHTEAETLKQDHQREHEVFPVIRPVVEKMATIVDQVAEQRPVEPIVVVGGASNFSEFTTTMAKVLDQPVEGIINPEFVTPLGIALSDDPLQEATSDGY
ncbi:ethanolamine utilization protein EutJ [Furfurilactobacillus siliginis]|uniref:Ethanolamine utilization protein EutJ n=1 Tax=Furfurilactobacillus siliginis TaxID=348151 RepID=A0A0R2L3M0_9LACO|nr:ethanolamine utilization protein EutJ [Furfurilactobacillus siliginis]KRN96222.1 ethanolamine utilization protein EutJ [Furfurilactobacillus siliginis]GEK27853.1 ethanolamine utilization protein EutJ [Furfurilactobacillus siliginis]